MDRMSTEGAQRHRRSAAHARASSRGFFLYDRERRGDGLLGKQRHPPRSNLFNDTGSEEQRQR